MADVTVISKVVSGATTRGGERVPVVTTRLVKQPVVRSQVAATGPMGVGVPSGGLDGQSLLKSGSGDYLSEWGYPSAENIAFTPSGSISSITIQDAIVELDSEKQPLDSELTALAGLSSAANKIPYFTGSGTAAMFDFKDEDNMASDSATAVPSQQSVKAYVDNKDYTSGDITDFNEAAQDAVGGIVDSTLVYVDGTPILKRAPITGDISVPDGSNMAAISAGVIVNADINASAAIDATKIHDGSISNTEFGYLNNVSSNLQTQLDNKQPLDAELTAIAGLTSAADRLPYFTGSGTAALATFTTFGRSLVDDANAAAAISTLGLDADIATLSLPASTTISTYGASLVDDADASTARTTLGLGTIATQNSNNVTITGGSISGITDLAIADGGTGASTKTAAFDALSPMTTSGDIIYGGASGTGTRLAKGSDGQILTLASGLPSWAAAPATYTDEQAQDAVGSILTDTTSVDFTYNDAGNTISAYAPANSRVVTQNSHGFVAGDVLRLSSGTYVKAQANSTANAEVVGIVQASVDTNNFILMSHGYVTGLSGLTAGTAYFLDPSTAGAYTSTEPSSAGQISKPLFVATSTTTVYFTNYRGITVTTAGGGGDVVGPGSATDNAIARFDSTTGKLIQNSVVTIADTTGDIAGTGSVSLRSAGFIGDANSNELIKFPSTVSSAVNEFTISNAATGSNPTLSATGGDSNIGLNFQVKGTGVYRFLSTSSGPTDLRLFEDTDNGTNYASIIAPASMASDRVLTLPDATDTLVGKATTDTLTNKTISSTTNSVSYATFTNPYKFRVRLTNAQNSTNATPKVQFNQEDFDTGSNFDTTNYNFTAPVAGFYFFTARLEFNPNGQSLIYLYKNNSALSVGNRINTGNNAVALVFSDFVQASASDVFDLRIYSDNTVAITVSSPNQPYFAGFLVSTT